MVDVEVRLGEHRAQFLRLSADTTLLQLRDSLPRAPAFDQHWKTYYGLVRSFILVVFTLQNRALTAHLLRRRGMPVVAGACADPWRYPTLSRLANQGWTGASHVVLRALALMDLIGSQLPC